MFLPAKPRLLIATGILCSTGILTSSYLRSQQPTPHRSATQEAQSVERSAYSSACAGCHGLDALGTERAPNIATSAKLRALSDSQIADIISNGIPGTGMPPFQTLSPAQVRSIVAHLRSLQGEADSKQSSGNADRGKVLFFGKGGCSNCHMVEGQGGFAGPDLTYDSSISAKTIREGIVSSNRVVRKGYKRAVVTTHDGKRIQGMLRNEDNFSAQLQDEDGAFHFFQKSDVQNIEYVKEPLMPTDYGSRLTPSELNDLVSFLMRSANSLPKTKPQKSEDWE